MNITLHSSSKKAYIPFCAYTFQDGFARELLIPFGHDPRKDPEAHLYVNGST